MQLRLCWNATDHEEQCNQEKANCKPYKIPHASPAGCHKSKVQQWLNASKQTDDAALAEEHLANAPAMMVQRQKPLSNGSKPGQQPSKPQQADNCRGDKPLLVTIA